MKIKQKHHHELVVTRQCFEEEKAIKYDTLFFTLTIRYIANDNMIIYKSFYIKISLPR